MLCYDLHLISYLLLLTGVSKSLKGTLDEINTLQAHWLSSHNRDSFLICFHWPPSARPHPTCMGKLSLLLTRVNQVYGCQVTGGDQKG